ncbi:putative aRAC-type regulatory protein [Escherichia coli P0304777.8]|nr:putative aRAC-type regulatory protein [Escherichia coli P0304777.8]
MYQRCFDNASETLFVAGKTPRLSRFAFSDDPKWESGHHVHDNETELFTSRKGLQGLPSIHRYMSHMPMI